MELVIGLSGLGRLVSPGAAGRTGHVCGGGLEDGPGCEWWERRGASFG